jgi:hypothetical protein
MMPLSEKTFGKRYKYSLSLAGEFQKSPGHLAFEPEANQKQVSDQGGPDLDEHGILGGSVKGLDLQTLLDPAKEDLDLPALPVDVWDGLGRQPEMVSEKHVNFAGGRVLVNDAAQGLGALSGSGAGRPHGLVGHQSQGGVDGKPLHYPVSSIALLAGNKEDLLGRELAIPGIIGVAQVLHDNGTLGEVQGQGLPHLMLPGRRNGHKGRQVAAMVQEGVEFDARPGATEGRPRKQGQTEAHHRGVHTEELVLELKLMPGGRG